MFAHHGIDLEWIMFPEGTGAMNKALRNKEIDLAVILTGGIIKDIANGNPSKILQVYVSSPLQWGVHVGAKSEFTSIELINEIIDLEKSSPLKRPNLNAMLGINQIVEASFQLLKTRLSMGLSYALWLSVFAASTFAIISLKVLPQFEHVYSEFGAQLPELTNIALSWQHSFFSPNLIGLLLVFNILMLLLAVRKISNDPYSKRSSLFFKVLQRMPIISPVFNISHAMFWMGHLKILTSAGLSLKQSLETLAKPPKILMRKLPQVIEQLEVAEKIDNLPMEIDYQSEQLQSYAEAIVSRASRNLVAFVLVLVMSFILFTIFATYLPIFQLGEAI